MAKRKTPEQSVQELCMDIRREIAHWIDLNENGGYDPFYPDGVNMNLTRNHVVYEKRQIVELCVEHGIPFPEELYLPIPPEVDDYYMANLKQKRRLELIGHPERITDNLVQQASSRRRLLRQASCGICECLEEREWTVGEVVHRGS